MGIIDRWFGGKPAEDNHAIQAVDEDVLTIKDEKGDIIGVVFLFDADREVEFMGENEGAA